MKKLKIAKLLVIIMILTVTLSIFVSCNENFGDTKPTYEEIWETYSSATQKSDDLSVSTKFTYYNKGSAEYVVPKVDMTRTMDGDLVYIDGVFYSGKASSGAESLANTLGLMATSIMKIDSETIDAVKDLFTPTTGDEGKIYFQLGVVEDDAINAKIDYEYGDTEPDYIWDSFSDSSMVGSLDSFYGIEMEAVDTILAETEHDYFMSLDVAETFMYADILSLVDVTGLTDSQSDSYNKGSSGYLYSYTLTDAQVKEVVVDLIESQFSYLATQMSEEDYAMFKAVYDEHKDTIYDMMTVTKATLNMTVSEDLQTVTATCDCAVDISLVATEIAEIFRDIEDFAEYADQVEGMFEAITLATGIGSKDNTSGKIDFNVDVSMSQTITYADIELDANDEIFSSANAVVEDRHFYYVDKDKMYDEEGNMNRLNEWLLERKYVFVKK